MSCEELRPLIAAWIDRELDPVDTLRVDAHLGACAACREHAQRLQAISGAVRAEASYHRAPAALAHRIRAALPDSGPSDVASPGRNPQPNAGPDPRAAVAPPSRPAAWRAWRDPRPGFLPGLRLGAGVGALAGGLAAALVVALLPLGPGAAPDAGDALASAHARALMTSHVIDVASSDRHTVRPWFTGRIDYAPPVVDFAEQGFALAGGRLDELGGRTVAVLVYRHGPHTIDLYVWPAERGTRGATGADDASVRRGYTLLQWEAASMRWAAVSDADATELRRLEALVRGAG